MVRAHKCLSRILILSVAAAVPSFPAAVAQTAPNSVSVGPGPILCIPWWICERKDARADFRTVDGAEKQIEVLAWNWGSADTPPAASADPQEGGEVAKGGAGRASVSEINPTKKLDRSSPVLMSKEPGKLEYPNLSVAPGRAGTPPQSGMVTLLVAAGTCVQGARYPLVTLRSEGKAYELQDVTVAECGPAGTARGKKTQTQKLKYLKFEMKEIQVTG